MAESDANRTSLYHSEETLWSEVPTTPTMLEVQRVSDTFAHQKLTQVPATIRTDRLNEDIIRVGQQAGGDFQFELRHTQYDLLLSAALGSTGFVVATTGVLTTLSAASADNSFNRTTGSFVTDGFVVGQWIRVSGFAGAGVTADNGDFLVVSVVALKIVVTATLVINAAGDSVTIRGKVARNGVAKRSFLFEKRFADITVFQQLRGQRVNTLALDMRNRAIITGAFGFTGAQGLYTGTTVAGTSTAAASNPAMDSSSGVSFFNEGGVAVTVPLFSLSINFNNNTGYQPALANSYPIGIRLGTLEITGTLVAYFETVTLLNKAINHTATSVAFRLVDNNGKALIISVNRIQFSEGTTPVTGQNSDVFLNLPFRAAYDSVTGYGCQLDSLA